MSNDFAKLRKSTSIEKLTKALQAEKTTYAKDSRYWELTTDKAKNGWAEIRFLPSPPDEEHPWVKQYTHFFKGPTGKYYSELSLTTLPNNWKDPVQELNHDLWQQYEATGNKDLKEVVSKQKRKLRYVSNILVVNDPAHPENNGKVFLFSYGKKIMDKIRVASGEQANENPEIPDDPDEVKFNAFCPWEGANFKLKCRQYEGYANYDLSTWKKPSPIGSDEEIEKLWRQEYKLQPLIAPDQFKSYDELKRRLSDVLGAGGGSASASTPSISKSIKTAESAPEVADEDDVPTAAQADAEIAAASTPTKPSVPSATVEDDDDDAEFARFKELARRV